MGIISSADPFLFFSGTENFIQFSFFFFLVGEGRKRFSKTFLQPLNLSGFSFFPHLFHFQYCNLAFGWKNFVCIFGSFLQERKTFAFAFCHINSRKSQEPQQEVGQEGQERWLSDTEWRLLKIISCYEFSEVFHPTVSLTTDLTASSSSSSSLATQSLVTLTFYRHI